MVIYYVQPKTGVVRGFHSLNLAEAVYPNTPLVNSTQSLVSLIKSHKTTLENAYEDILEWAREGGRASRRLERLNNPSPEDVLDLIKEVADIITAAPKLAQTRDSPGKLSKTKGWTVNLQKARDFAKLWAAGETPSVTPQVVAMVKCFATEGYDYYTRQEMQRFMETARVLSALKTRQSGWRIFRYYKATLEALEILK